MRDAHAGDTCHEKFSSLDRAPARSGHLASRRGQSRRSGSSALSSLPDLYGRTISLDYFDGHPGSIVFWSVISPRSIELLDDVRAYNAKWGREDLAIVAINADGKQAGASGLKTLREYAERLDLIFPMLVDDGQESLGAYGVTEVPMAVVVDAGGRVSSIVRGYTPTLRAELKGSLLLAMGDASGDTSPEAVADRGGQEEPPRAAAGVTAPPAASSGRTCSASRSATPPRPIP